MEEKELEKELQEDKVEEIKEVDQISLLTKELEESKKEYTRLLAEFQNFSKRKTKEVEETKKYASEDIIKKFIDNVENLDRAIESSKDNKDYEGLLKGIEMIYANLKNVLKEEGLEEVEALGKIFNPLEHQAMGLDNKEDKENEEILMVLQKGYKLKNKIIRPAMVIMNKK